VRVADQSSSLLEVHPQGAKLVMRHLMNDPFSEPDVVIDRDRYRAELPATRPADRTYDLVGGERPVVK